LSQGLSTILPYMTKRIVTVSKRDFIAVLSSHNPTVDGFTIKTKKEVTNLGKFYSCFNEYFNTVISFLVIY